MREQADEVVLVIGAGTIGCLAVNVCKAYKASKIICIDVIDWKLEIAKKMGADIVVNSKHFKTFEERMNFMMKETDNNGVGIIIECSGHAPTISSMFKYLRKGGTAVLVGLPKQDLVFNDPMPVKQLILILQQQTTHAAKRMQRNSEYVCSFSVLFFLLAVILPLLVCILHFVFCVCIMMKTKDIVFKSLTLKTIHGRRIFSTWKESERLISEGLIDCDAVISDEIPLSKFEDGYAKLKSGKALKIIFDVTK